MLIALAFSVGINRRKLNLWHRVVRGFAGGTLLQPVMRLGMRPGIGLHGVQRPSLRVGRPSRYLAGWRGVAVGRGGAGRAL